MNGGHLHIILNTLLTCMLRWVWWVAPRCGNNITSRSDPRLAATTKTEYLVCTVVYWVLKENMFRLTHMIQECTMPFLFRTLVCIAEMSNLIYLREISLRRIWEGLLRRIWIRRDEIENDACISGRKKVNLVWLAFFLCFV